MWKYCPCAFSGYNQKGEENATIKKTKQLLKSNTDTGNHVEDALALLYLITVMLMKQIWESGGILFSLQSISREQSLMTDNSNKWATG